MLEGVDIRWSMVLDLAGGGRMDVHGIDIEFVRHQSG